MESLDPTSLRSLAVYETLGNPDLVYLLKAFPEFYMLPGEMIDWEETDELSSYEYRVMKEVSEAVERLMDSEDKWVEEWSEFLEDCEINFEERFGEAVRGIEERNRRGERFVDMPELVGVGEDAYVFRIEVDGQEYALKIYHKCTMVIYVEAMLATAGIKNKDRLPNLYGFSLKKNMLVMDLCKGVSLKDFIKQKDPIWPSDEHLRGLIELFIELNQKSINLDLNWGNILYDPDYGFVFIDMGYINNSGTLNSRDLERSLINLNGVLMDSLFEVDRDKADDLSARLMKILEEEYEISLV